MPNQSEKPPLVSMVIPCYNHEQFVQASIQSVIEQTYDNIELIIIDDGSTDDTVGKIKEMLGDCEKRFSRFEFRARPNKGLSATLNEALEWSKGKYYAPLASDDIILREKTAVTVAFLEENPETIAVSAGVKRVDANDKVLRTDLRKAGQYDFESIIMNKHDFPTATQMIRLSAIEKVGGYNANIKLEDWYMWLKLSQIGHIYYIDQVLGLYRQHGTNFSADLQEMTIGRIAVLDCFKDSIYYQEAMDKVIWSHARRDFESSTTGKLQKFMKMFKMKPLKASNALFKYGIKTLKGK